MVRGSSMNPNYSDFSVVLATTKFNPEAIRRDDIVVFHHDGQRYIKRVGFVGGDSIKGINIARNSHESCWQWLYYPVPAKSPNHFGSRYFKIPPETFFALSDNSSCATDSRSLGPIPLSDVESVVVNPAPNPNV